MAATREDMAFGMVRVCARVRVYICVCVLEHMSTYAFVYVCMCVCAQPSTDLCLWVNRRCVTVCPAGRSRRSLAALLRVANGDLLVSKTVAKSFHS